MPGIHMDRTIPSIQKLDSNSVPRNIKILTCMDEVPTLVRLASQFICV